MISLSVPGALEYRDVAVRVVGAACKLLGPPADGARRASDPHGEPSPPTGGPGAGAADLADPFAMAVISAFSEAFNNVALHGYRGMPPGRIDLEIVGERTGDAAGTLTIRLRDTGRTFDPSGYDVPPDELPERGMGLFIMRSFLDELRYEPGPPNLLVMVKRWPVTE